MQICRRGLSKFYEGKSQSFTSLASVRSIEDLAKEESPNQKRLKLSKSFEENLDRRPESPLYSPKSAASKNAPRVIASPFSPSSKTKKARSSILGLHGRLN